MTQSKTTYATVRKALDRADSPYAARDYEIFLQGSYGNDTNIHAESDVDIVIQLNSAFHYDLDDLSIAEKAAFKTTISDAPYGLSQFRNDVLGVLKKEFGSNVKEGEKAIKISAGGGRRSADVIPAIAHRRYKRFPNLQLQQYTSGIYFKTTSGQEIINYPKLHSINLTTKHQLSSERLKPVIRVFKNMRSWLVEHARLAPGTAPSYYVEGLLYNVPNEEFSTNHATTVHNCLTWLFNSPPDEWTCANGEYMLVHETSPVTWRADKRNAFVSAAVRAWNEW